MANAGVAHPSRRVTPADGSPDWIFGRGIDLWIGCGLLYLASVPLLWLLQAGPGVEAFPPMLVLGLLVLLNTPHFGATLVRVYAQREDRRRYAIFAVWITLALIGLGAWAARDVWVASLVITLYVTWSPWHFAGQNYGLAVLFLRKRGVAFERSTQRLLYASFIASAWLSIVSIHAGGPGSVFAPTTMQLVNAPAAWSPALSRGWIEALLLGLALVYAGSLGAFLWRLRGAGISALAPSLLLVATQALWFTVPPLIFESVQDQLRSLVFASVWITTLHSVQYLWISAYYANRSPGGPTIPSFLLKSFAAGTAAMVVPAVLLSPEALGRLPWDVGLAAVVFSMVNLHHFVLDGAIWKLRDGRIARILVRPSDSGRADLPTDEGAPLWRRALWVAAGLCALVPVASFTTEQGLMSERNYEAVQQGFDRLALLGRESVRMRLNLARSLERTGQWEGAREQYEAAHRLFPSSHSWLGLGNVALAQGRNEDAADSYAHALEIEPSVVPALYGQGLALIRQTEGQARGHEVEAQARQALERVLELEPGHRASRTLLRRLEESP